MKYKKILFTVMFFIFSVISVIGQNNCPTGLDFEWVKKNDPARYERLMNYERIIGAKTSGAVQSERLIDPNGVIIIPVVFHILHHPSNPAQNISDARIQEQIQVLNEDFRRLNADASNTPAAFAGLAADLKYEFRLACIDPQGLPSNGIVRKQVTVTRYTYIWNPDNTTNEIATGVKLASTGDAPWDTDSYLNIWVCDINLGGYATFPWDYSANAIYDGVVVSYGTVGKNISGKGRVATHEVGHWLGLYHIFQGGCSPAGDGVSDTPAQIANNSGCPAYPELTNRCGTNVPSTMFMNYMDYTTGECKNIYTTGQKNRTRGYWSDLTSRGGHLINYFRILPVPNTITCTGNINLRNVACLPVTWSVVSGPVTIFSGQGTNNLTIKTTGTGEAVIRAVSGNYDSEITVNVVHSTVPSVSGTYPHYTGNTQTLEAMIPKRPTIYNEVCDGIQITPAMSITPGSTVVWSFVAASTPNFYWSQSGNSVTFYFIGGIPDETAILNVSVTNECGTVSRNYAFKSKYCSGGPQLKVSPNPAVSNIQISFDKPVFRSNATTVSLIREARITDRAGRVLRKFSFGSGMRSAKLNITGLKPDLYFVQVFDGEKWITSKILVK